MKPTYRKSWAVNLPMWSDVALGPSFKVKLWFTGFGEKFFILWVGDLICNSSGEQMNK